MLRGTSNRLHARSPARLPRSAAWRHYLGFPRPSNDMSAPSALFESNLQSLPLIARGKVRDIYRVDDQRLLILASDRLSAFDVVLPDPIPGKGIVLTAISNFWFHRLQSVIPNHLTGTDPVEVLSDPRAHPALQHP